MEVDFTGSNENSNNTEISPLDKKCQEPVCGVWHPPSISKPCYKSMCKSLQHQLLCQGHPARHNPTHRFLVRPNQHIPGDDAFDKSAETLTLMNNSAAAQSNIETSQQSLRGIVITLYINL